MSGPALAAIPIVRQQNSVPESQRFGRVKTPPPLSMSTFNQVVDELAVSDFPVLLLGEPGVGKHIVARRIHETAYGSDAPFLEYKCRGIDESTIRQIFNHGHGSTSEPSTAYFEHLEALSASAQRILLACVEAKEGNARWPRIIASGTSELEMDVRMGRFREDLYYRLSAVCLPIPPLRYRKEEIGRLADQYLEKYAVQFNRPRPELTPALLRFLHAYPWVGNLHELEDAMRTVVAVGNVRVAIAALQSSALTIAREKKNGNGSISLKQVARAASQRAERELILKVLSRTHWNRKKAAEELRISYKALLYKLKEISLSPGVAIGQGGNGQ